MELFILRKKRPLEKVIPLCYIYFLFYYNIVTFSLWQFMNLAVSSFEISLYVAFYTFDIYGLLCTAYDDQMATRTRCR